MARKLYRRERLDKITEDLDATGYVSVADLSRLFDVSAVTVRSDLDVLEEEGALIRTHGGAVPVSDEGGRYSFAVRRGENIQAKERIGAYCAGLVRDGEAVVMDASTTTWHMARRLGSKRDVTVFTNGLHVALELLRHQGVSAMVPGGVLWREAAAVVGHCSEELLSSGNYVRGFFGGRGLSIKEGLTDAYALEVELKRQMLQAVSEVNVIVDSAKVGRVAFAELAQIQEIDRIVTDSAVNPEFVAQARQLGVEVVIV